MKRRTFFCKAAAALTVLIAPLGAFARRHPRLKLRRLNIWRPNVAVICDQPFSAVRVGDVCSIVPNGNDNQKRFRVLEIGHTEDSYTQGDYCLLIEEA